MNLISTKVTYKLLRTLINNPIYPDIYHVVSSNRGMGKIYLVGGKVYRGIIEELYGYPARLECCDFDFVVEQTNPVVFTNGDTWFYEGTGNYSRKKKIKLDSQSIKLRKGNTSVDIISLGSLPHIVENNLPRTIDNYFESVPLDIQAIAIDLDDGKILGRGQTSIVDRKIKVNNRKVLDEYCKLKKTITPESYLEKKAKSVRFSI